MCFGLFALSKNFKLGVLSYANMWNFRTFLYEWSLYGSMQESVPTWDFKITLLYFFASAIFLGAIVYYCFFENSKHERKMSFLQDL